MKFLIFCRVFWFSLKKGWIFFWKVSILWFFCFRFYNKNIFQNSLKFFFILFYSGNQMRGHHSNNCIASSNKLSKKYFSWDHQLTKLFKSKSNKLKSDHIKIIFESQKKMTAKNLIESRLIKIINWMLIISFLDTSVKF